MKTIKNIISLNIFITLFATALFSQNYLDSDKRFMKLAEVSNDKTYGFDIKNPILVGPDEKAIGSYLNSLKPLDGDRLHIGDMKFNYKNQTGLTLVVLKFEQKKETITIYFQSNKFSQPKAIKGFSFKTIDDLPKVVLFPAEKIVKVAPCSETVYSVDDFLLKEKIGLKPAPNVNPVFENGIEELQKYFTANPLKNEKAAQMIFRVSIGFVINCEGKAGNFEIITKGRGDLATYANEVLGIVNNMPQNWKPATVDGKAVDSYQVLSFSVASGNLDKVSYQ